MALPGGLTGWDLLALAAIVALLAAFAIPRVQWMRFRRRRRAVLERFEREQGSKVLTLIHGKAPVSFLGWPVYRMIDMEDAEDMLRAIRRAGPDKPLDIILHTPGGMYLASLQIARALQAHPARVRAFVPFVAMSGGTLIALGADEIVMDPGAVMGAVDPQLGDFLHGVHSAASWLRVARAKGKEADDATLAMSDVSEKLLEGTRRAVGELVAGKARDVDKLLDRLVEGGLAHGYPLSAKEMQELGLPVRTDMPPQVYDLLAVYRPRGWRGLEG
jgi:ClpP class serine protease